MTMMFLYDADCGFCTATVNRIRRFFPRVDFRASRTVDLAQFNLTERDTQERAYLIVPAADNSTAPTIYQGGRAITGLAASWGRPGRIIATVLGFRPVALPIEIVYKLVARNRHKLPGGGDSCTIGA